MSKVVFITGAAKNTGYAIAEKFAQNGYQVALSSRKAQQAKDAAEKLSKQYDIKAEGYGLTLWDTDEVKRVFRDIKKTFGRLDTFVSNAAHLGVDQDLLHVTEQDYEQLMTPNVKCAYFCCQQAADIMKAQGGGAIVIIGSIHYQKSIFGRSLYAISKGALASLTRSAAYELAQYGIRVNYIAAGAIKTDRWKNFTPEQVAARRGNWPLGIESTGEDIANGAFYLGTPLSRTVTGVDLTIDSGVSICMLAYQKGQ